MILVTGATGILGRVIALQLLKDGKKVRATKRPDSNTDEVRQSLRFYTENPDEWFEKIEWVNVDFEDISQISNALNGVKEVYHCAGFVSFNPADRLKLYHTNINNTKNLLYACEGSSVEKFLFVSSIGALDSVNERGELDEESNFNPKLEHSHYAKSKHFSEMEVWRTNAEGLNTIILNPAIIIGSGNWQRSSGNLFRTFQKSKYTFSGGSAYVDVRDVATAALKLMEANAFGERFIISAENKTYAEVGNLVRRELGLGTMKILPKSILNSLKWLRIFGFLFPKLKLINKANIETLTTHTPISNQKITDQLGFQFIPIEESIAFHTRNYKSDLSAKV